jgi:transmembrane sensor
VGTAIVRAVGTQFNIDRRTDRATVTVVEGSVQVMAKREGPQGSAAGSSDPSQEPVGEVIAAAQRVVVTESGMSPPERIADLAPVTAWTQRQLVFENRSLSEVAAEFNRYNRHRILIESDELQAQQVTGVFLAHDASSFLAFISGIPGVSVRRAENGDHVVYMNSLETGGGPN